MSAECIALVKEPNEGLRFVRFQYGREGPEDMVAVAVGFD